MALGVLHIKENQSHSLLDALENGSAAVVASVVVRGCVLPTISSSAVKPGKLVATYYKELECCINEQVFEKKQTKKVSGRAMLVCKASISKC